MYGVVRATHVHAEKSRTNCSDGSRPAASCQTGERTGGSSSAPAGLQDSPDGVVLQQDSAACCSRYTQSAVDSRSPPGA